MYSQGTKSKRAYRSLTREKKSLAIVENKRGRLISPPVESRSLFQCALRLFVLLLFQIFCMFNFFLFPVLVFVLFAAFVSHCVPPLVLRVIFPRSGTPQRF
jgi:hypothetical protein